MDDSAGNLAGGGPERVELIVDADTGGLWTGPVPIVSGSGFPPLKEIRIEASCRDGVGRLWKSSNEYLVSAEGRFDTANTAAVGQGYYGKAQEGLFYSMDCEDGTGHDFAWRQITKLSYRLACFDAEREIWSGQIARSVGRLKSERPQPFVRVYYFDDNLLSEDGHAVLALSARGVNVALVDARVTNALPVRNDLPTAIVASGRASARALELAIRSPEVRSVILFSGGGLRFDAGDRGPGQSGSADHVQLDHSRLRPRAEGALATRGLYAEAVADRANRERGRIEVEKIACPIYMFSGLDDQIWPASAFSELVAQRRKMKGCPFPTYHRTFEGVGHDLGPGLGLPTLPTTERTVSHPETGFRLLLGGKMGRQARARRECWDTLLRILGGDPPQA